MGRPPRCSPGRGWPCIDACSVSSTTSTPKFLSTVGLTVELQGRLAEAEQMFAECLRIGRAQLPADHPGLATYLVNLARVQIARGRAGATEAAASRSAPAAHGRMRADDWRIGQVQGLLGASLVGRGRDAEAESLMRAADRLLPPIAGQAARDRDANRARLAALYRASGRPSRPTWRADPGPPRRLRFLREPTPTKKIRRATSSSPRGSRSFT